MDSLNQIISSWLGGIGWTAEAAVRLLLAGLLGSIVGLQRELRGHEAGFRTNLLVCLGSALAMIVSMHLADMRWVPNGNYNINVDPGRIAYGIMTGIGFLGAGAILKNEQSVRGLTTAAGLWCVSAIGLAVGEGLYVLSILGTLLVLGALWVLHAVQERLPVRRQRRIVLRGPWDPQFIGQVSGRLSQCGMQVTDHSFYRNADLAFADYVLWIAFNNHKNLAGTLAELVEDGQHTLVSSERA